MRLNTGFEEYHRRVYKDYDRFAAAIRRPQRKSLRANTLKASKEKVESILASRGVEYSPVPWCPDGFWVPQDFDLDTIEHQLGFYYVQNSSSMIPSMVLDPKPGERVLDLCAAPGSKTTHIAQLMGNRGLLVANEISYVRIRALVINLQRSGVTNAVVTRRDACGYEKLGERFDRVMLDAPCSDVGTARKNPMVIRDWSLERVRKLRNLQKKLIASAYDCLVPGGVLVYSTCTTSEEENEDVVEDLLRNRRGAALEKVSLPGLKTRRGLTSSTKDCARVAPQDNDTEAYFIAKVVRNG